MTARYSFILFFLCLMHINLQAMIVIYNNKLDPDSDKLLGQFVQMRLYNLHNSTMKVLLQTTIVYSSLQGHNLFNKYNQDKIASSDIRTVLKNVLANAQYEVEHALRHEILGNFNDRLSFLCANHAARFVGITSFHDYKIGQFSNIQMACNVGDALRKMHEQFPAIYNEWKAKPITPNKLAIDWLVEKTECEGMVK